MNPAPNPASKVLHYNDKDFSAVKLKNGRNIGVFRYYENNGLGKKTPGPWLPHNGLIFVKGKEVPIIADTKEFWHGEITEYGTKEIKNICKEMDSLKIEKGLPTSQCRSVNNLLEDGERLNDQLDIADSYLSQKGLLNIDLSVANKVRKEKTELVKRALKITSDFLKAEEKKKEKSSKYEEMGMC
jgi:hypothetical protein